MTDEVEDQQEEPTPTAPRTSDDQKFREILEQLWDGEYKNSSTYQKDKRIRLALDKSLNNFYSDREYLQTVVNQDRGTAGGEVEKLVAAFLKKYFPTDIKFIIGGKIILENDQLSPQIDLILTQDLPAALDGSYIPHDYVVAAFEVKTTLLRDHLKKIAETAEKLRPFARLGKPREVLFGKIIYGVIALSSNFKGPRKPPSLKNLKDNDDELNAFRKAFEKLDAPPHPSQAVDLILVADAFSLVAQKTIHYSELFPNTFPDVSLSYRLRLSRGSGTDGASNFAITISKPPRSEHLGAFIYGLSLMLRLEGVTTRRQEDAFLSFRPNMAYGSYEWNIQVLGDQFRKEWVEHIDDESDDWQFFQPFDG